MTFYFHNMLRRYSIIMGSLFSNIYVKRHDEYDIVRKTIKVPLTYGRKKKVYYDFKKKEQEATIRRPIGVLLPRMSFNLDSVSYDSERQNDPKAKIVIGTSGPYDGGDVKTIKSPVPYNLTYTLSIWTKYIEEADQIVEQIYPHFAPYVSLVAIDMAELQRSRMIRVQIDSNTISGVEELSENPGDIDTITWDITFTIKGWMYPPITDSKIIKKAIVKMRGLNPELEPDDKILYLTETDTVVPLTALKNEDWKVEESINEMGIISVRQYDKEAIEQLLGQL